MSRKHGLKGAAGTERQRENQRVGCLAALNLCLPVQRSGAVGQATEQIVASLIDEGPGRPSARAGLDARDDLGLNGEREQAMASSVMPPPRAAFADAPAIRIARRPRRSR